MIGHAVGHRLTPRPCDSYTASLQVIVKPRDRRGHDPEEKPMSQPRPLRGQQRRPRLLPAVMATLALSCALPAAAQAQDFPARPIRLIEGFGAGGVVDLVARLVMPKRSLTSPLEP